MNPMTRLMICLVVSNISQNLVHSVTPTFITELGLPDYVFGTFYACMALGMMIMSPIWGKLIDKYGKRIAFVLGNVGYILAQILFFYGGTEALIMLGRLLGGMACSGSVVSLLAGVVDLSDEKNRAKNLSVYAAINTLSSSIGYFVGGIVGSAVSVRGTFFTQYICEFLTILLGILLIPSDKPVSFTETTAPDKAAADQGKHVRLRQALAIMTPTLMLYLVCVVLSSIGTNGYDNSFNYYLKEQLNFPAAYNGIIKALTGVMGLIATMWINALLLKHFRTSSVLLWVFFACTVSLWVSTLMQTIPSFVVFSLIFCLFYAMYQPLLQSLMTRASNCDYGLLSGLFNSARSLGMIAGALASGFLYTVAPKAPFVLQELCYLLAAFVLLAFIKLSDDKKKKAEEKL